MNGVTLSYSFNHLTLITDKSSTVIKNDVVVHKAYCFDLDLYLMPLKVTNNFVSTLYNGCSTKLLGMRLRRSYLVGYLVHFLAYHEHSGCCTIKYFTRLNLPESFLDFYGICTVVT